ncbi:MAG: flavin reductase family protein [Deltaproteobacteria bacterium]|nr:flavin reductase family protein [Deltaproteobacteria bacterium]
MNKAEVKPLSSAYRLLNPGSVVLVSVGDGTRDNLFPVTWNTPVRQDPPMVAIVSGKRHFSYPLIVERGEFGLNVLQASLVDAVLGCGSTSGRDVEDKFARFGLTREKAGIIRPPLVEEAVASLECRVCQVVDLGSSAILVAQVVRALASTEHFREGQWRFDSGLELLHHLSGSRFCVTVSEITGRKPG